MDFNISSATRGHVTLSNFLDLSESNSRFKVRMQVVTAGWVRRLKPGRVSLDVPWTRAQQVTGTQRRAGPALSARPHPTSGRADLPQTSTQTWDPCSISACAAEYSLLRLPTYLLPPGQQLTQSRGHTRSESSRPGRREPEMPALGP